MSVLGRMGRSITQSFDALLDKLEDPRRSIEQTLSEMREQVRAARREIVSSVAREKQLRARVEALDVQVHRWEERAALAVRGGDDELGRAALFQKRRVRAERERADELRAAERQNALDMKRELERMERRVREIDAKKGTLATQVQRAQSPGIGVESLGGDGAAFGELRRLEAEIEGVELAVEAQREVDEALRPAGPSRLSADELEAKFRRLEAESEPGGDPDEPAAPSDVDVELAALKRRFRVAP